MLVWYLCCNQCANIDTLIKVHTLLDSLCFYLMSFFCFRIPSRMPYYIQQPYLLRFLLVETVSQTFLILEISTILRSSSLAFCRMSLDWGLSHVFLMIRLGIYVVGRKVTEIKCHHIISKVYTINMIYDHLAEVEFVSFLHCRVYSFLPIP